MAEIKLCLDALEAVKGQVVVMTGMADRTVFTTSFVF